MLHAAGLPLLQSHADPGLLLAFPVAVTDADHDAATVVSASAVATAAAAAAAAHDGTSASTIGAAGDSV